MLRQWSRCWSYSLLVCGSFYEAICFAITSLGEERASLGAFCAFVRFVLVWFCLFPLPLGVWDGLRFVIVALPGLFSFLFCDCGTPWAFLLPFLFHKIRPCGLVFLPNDQTSNLINESLPNILSIFNQKWVKKFASNVYTRLFLDFTRLMRFWFQVIPELDFIQRNSLSKFYKYHVNIKKMGKRKAQGVPQSQTAALPRL